MRTVFIGFVGQTWTFLERVTDPEGDDNGLTQIENCFFAALAVGGMAGSLILSAGKKVDFLGQRIGETGSRISADEKISLRTRAAAALAGKRDIVSGVGNGNGLVITELRIAN